MQGRLPFRHCTLCLDSNGFSKHCTGFPACWPCAIQVFLRLLRSMFTHINGGGRGILFACGYGTAVRHALRLIWCLVIKLMFPAFLYTLHGVCSPSFHYNTVSIASSPPSTSYSRCTCTSTIQLTHIILYSPHAHELARPLGPVINFI